MGIDTGSFESPPTYICKPLCPMLKRQNINNYTKKCGVSTINSDNKIMKTLLLLAVIAFSYEVALSQSNMGMYYVSGKPGEHGIWLSIQDNMNQWPRGNKVLLNGAFDGDAVDPDIIQLNNGLYRMYYFKGYFVTPPPPNPGLNKIYSAESQDGINYTINGVAFQYQDITDPSVVKLNNGEYLMACTQMIGMNIHSVIAKSTDGGLTFTYVTTVLNTGVPELYVLSDGSVRLFYNSSNSIVSKRSYDNGNTWQTETGVRLSASQFVGDPGVIKADTNKWWLFVKGFNGNGNPGPAGHKIMLAESTDETNSFSIIQNLVLDSASVPEGVILNPLSFIAENTILPDKLMIYPNPFNSKTVLQTEGSLNNAILTVYNSFGQTVKEIKNIKGTEVTLEKNNLPSGLYFVRLTQNNKIITADKLIITD